MILTQTTAFCYDQEAGIYISQKMTQTLVSECKQLSQKLSQSLISAQEQESCLTRRFFLGQAANAVQAAHYILVNL